jgi:hypothetical protein
MLLRLNKERGHDMSESTMKPRITKTNTIMMYGSSNDKLNIPDAPATIVNLFSIVASEYMTVPAQFLADVIRFLKESGYVYKVRHATGYSVFALQYVKPI